MNKHLESKLSMYNAVLQHCEQHPDITASVPAFKTSVQTFKTVVTAIAGNLQEHVRMIKGVTLDKQALRKVLVQRVAALAANVYAYAVDSENLTLQEEVRRSPSGLERLREDLLAPHCKNVLAVAELHKVKLADYGVTSEILTEVKDLIDGYMGLLPAPRNAISDRSGVNKTLETLFARAGKILTGRMDKLVINFKKENSTFYNAYKSNRKIVNSNTSRTQLKGKITTANGKAPLRYANIRLLGTDFMTQSSRTGSFVLKGVAPGLYDVAVSKPGHEEQVLHEVALNLGKATLVTVDLAERD